MIKHFLLTVVLAAAWIANAASWDFEKADKSYAVYTYVKHKNTPHAKGMKMERSALKAQSGKYSLELNNENPDGTFHFNVRIPRPLQPGGVKLKFHYFIAESTGKVGISGRIGQINEKGKFTKPLHFFGTPIQNGLWLSCESVIYPRPDCRTIQATIWFSGRMRVYVDNVELAPFEQKAGKTEKADVFAGGDFGTVFAVPADRPVRSNGVPAVQKKESVLRFKGPKGSRSAAIVALAPLKKYNRLEVEFEEPANRKGLFSVNVLEFINMKNPDNPAMKGLHSDPLRERSYTSAAPGKNSCFYIEVAIPRTAPAGVLKGAALKLKADGKLICRIPCEVTVRNFALPAVPYLKTYMPVRAHNGFRKFDPRPRSIIVNELLEHCSRERFNPQGGLEVGARLHVKVVNDKVAVTDWTQFDHAMQRMIKHGFDRVRLALPTFGANQGWFLAKGLKEPHYLGVPLLSEKGLRYLGETAKLYCDRLKTKYPGVTGYAYLYDEPPEHLTADVKKIFAAVNKYAPDCKIYLTGGYGRKYTKEVFAFCMPLAPGYTWSEEEATKLLAGKEIWYYNWNAPLDKNTYHINRLFPWLGYTVHGMGSLVWHSNDTGSLKNPVNPWTDMERTYGCGGVTLLYPPYQKGEKTAASLRLRHRGDALEDFDCLKLLENSVDRYFPGFGRKRVLEIIKEVIPEAPFKWLNDPDKISAVRNRLEDEIETFAQSPVVLVTSNPVENTQLILPEVYFTIYAPQNCVVTLPGGKKVTFSKDKVCRFKYVLPRLGENKINFTFEYNGKKKQIFRQFTLLPDPLLNELEKIGTAADKALVKKCKSSVYTSALRNAVSRRILAIKESRLKSGLAAAKKFTSPLSKALLAQAEKCIAWKLPERAGYYLALSREAASFPQKSAVRIVPFVQNDHFGVQLDNGIIQARFLETGGRLIAFKVRNVENFALAKWVRPLPGRDRAAKVIPADMNVRMPEYGGMEDSSGGNHRWPVSAVDWDLELIEQSNDKAVIAFSSLIPGTPFRIRRAATLKRNSSEVQFDYTITNTAPRDLQSDDPESFQLPWRLRMLPGIGADGAAWDQIRIPAVNKVPKTEMNVGKPGFFSALFPLKEPLTGAFDRKAGGGFLLTGDKRVVTHIYSWFDDRARSKGHIYTLEPVRSLLLKKIGEDNGNAPFTILPGTEFNFRLFLKGFAGAGAFEKWQNAR